MRSIFLDNWDINTTFALWGLVLTTIGTVLGALAFMPGWKDYQDWLEAGPDYRQKTAKTLRDQG